MAHHPTGAHSGALGGIVHGAMILLLSLMAYGFLHLAVRRGIARPPVLAGLVAYGISLFAHLGAATINGFVVPALAARGAGAVAHDIFLLAWEMNQALARLGVFATGAAFVIWSIDFLIRGGAWPKILGILGLLAGAIPALLLVTGSIGMNVAGAFIAYAAYAGWTLLVGLVLWLGRAANDDGAAASG